MSRDSVGSGFGFGIGIYLALIATLVVLPMLTLFMFCGGCAIITGGGVASLAETGRKIQEEERKQKVKEANDAVPKAKDGKPIVVPEPEPPAPSSPHEEPEVESPAKPAVTLPPKPTTKPERDDFGRAWRNKKGEPLFRAEFVEYRANKAVLKKSDGSTVEVPSVDLSADDQQWIRDELKRRKAK